MATQEFLCARCARHTITCCQNVEVYITPGDVDRIAAHAGHREFYEFCPPNDPVYLKQDDDPIWPQLVFKDLSGTRRILRRQPNGDCYFLGSQGCKLPLESRPLICRLFPLDFNEQGILPVHAKGCPLELLPTGQGLLHALDMNLADAEHWRRQLYEELSLELTADDYRADL